MSKNIVICLDGTGNKFKEDNSNIVKLVRVLTKDPQKQIVYYDAGVGTLPNPNYRTKLFKALSLLKGLALGRGINQDIKQAYTYIMNNYESGDRLYIFGFSRGAYTARSVAGMIHSCGLLEKGNTQLVPYAFSLFKAKKIKHDVLAKFKKTFGRKCDIQLLGLFDTVRSLGSSFNPLFYPYTDNNESVKAVRHALAIDEKRIFYKPILWGKEFKDKQDIKELWFAGVHSDVGGGYPEEESGLAKIPLKWMIDEVTKKPFSIIKDEDNYQRYVLGKGTSDYVSPDINADAHNSLKGFWHILQHFPIAVWNETTNRVNLKFTTPDREIPEDATFHPCVHERLKKPNYKPSNLNH